MKSNIKVTEASSESIQKIASIHCTSLPEDFLPSLGIDFLTNTFYPSAISSNYGKVFIAQDIKNNYLLGFVLVTTDSSVFLQNVIKRKFWSFLRYGIKSSFKSFLQLQKNIEIVFNSLLSDNSSKAGEIYVIAVDKDQRGKGVGKKLVHKASEYIYENNLNSIRIKTLKSNTNWIRFFIKSEWELIKSFTLIGNEYVVLEQKFDFKKVLTNIKEQ